MKISFTFHSALSFMKDPFNGDEIDMERVPGIGEHICFDGANRYKVRKVTTYMEGWKTKYIVVLE